MLLKDYYTILELEPSATLPEIKKAYRRLALQYHPDINPNDSYAAAQFVEIKEAYETLTIPAKKNSTCNSAGITRARVKEEPAGNHTCQHFKTVT